MNWKKPIVIACGAIAGFLAAGYVVGQDAPVPETPAVVPDAAPAAPATAPTVEIAEDAKPLLQQLGEAYKSLKSISMTGTLKADFDVAGQKVNQSADFTASYLKPDKFRHEMKDSLLMGSTGLKQYVYSEGEKVYKIEDAPKGPLHLDDLMYPMPFVLARQNPALMLALAEDPQKEAIQGATKVTRGADTTIDGTGYPTLVLDSEQGEISLVLDPRTHLLRRMSVDMKQVLGAQGQEQVKQAQVVFDYASQETGATFDEAHFAWAPPEGAKDAATLQQGPANPTEALVGKPAPEFALAGLDGKEVALADLKGNVVVLDFWATWCGPCVVSLPLLDEFAKKAPKDVKVFAVNLQEEKAQVQEFIKQHNLSLPVLLDSQGAAAQKYSVQAIPATVVIGKDGTVKASFVGAGNEPRVEAAVTEALGQ